jgi:hypothetical protein
MRFPFRDFWSRLIGKFGDFTSHYGQRYSGIEDYELKERVTVELSGGGF